MPFTITFPSEDFSLDSDDLSQLTIREASTETGFCYFYDTGSNRLIKHFVLSDGPRVSLMCDVTIIKKPEGGGCSPRITLWKKDKTRGGTSATTEQIPDVPTNRQVKARVDTSDGHENFWKLINFLQAFKGISLPSNAFNIVEGDSTQLASLLQAQDKQVVIEAVRAAIGSDLSDQDIALIANRRQALQRFERLLGEPEYFEAEKVRLAKTDEGLWQTFFQENQWIFGYGLKLIPTSALDGEQFERITTGANIFQGAGKRSDAVMRSRGYISSLLFGEIKTHQTPLLARKPYRAPDVYHVSSDISGAVAQVQKTARKAARSMAKQIERLYENDGTPTATVYSTTRPRQLVLAGNLQQFLVGGLENPEQMETFELYRTSINDTELITFDELFERAMFIVKG